MDRNEWIKHKYPGCRFVALRKESVDRNRLILLHLALLIVALRKESVDRNFQVRIVTGRLLQSLSARRAWIEITLVQIIISGYAVALRKESVDRNYPACSKKLGRLVALRKESVDRNSTESASLTESTVALRKESVDRNCDSDPVTDKAWGRSPQGERG